MIKRIVLFVWGWEEFNALVCGFLEPVPVHEL